MWRDDEVKPGERGFPRHQIPSLAAGHRDVMGRRGVKAEHLPFGQQRGISTIGAASFRASPNSRCVPEMSPRNWSTMCCTAGHLMIRTASSSRTVARSQARTSPRWFLRGRSSPTWRNRVRKSATARPSPTAIVGGSHRCEKNPPSTPSGDTHTRADRHHSRSRRRAKRRSGPDELAEPRTRSPVGGMRSASNIVIHVASAGLGPHVGGHREVEHGLGAVRRGDSSNHRLPQPVRNRVRPAVQVPQVHVDSECDELANELARLAVVAARAAERPDHGQPLDHSFACTISRFGMPQHGSPCHAPSGRVPRSRPHLRPHRAHERIPASEREGGEDEAVAVYVGADEQHRPADAVEGDEVAPRAGPRDEAARGRATRSGRNSARRTHRRSWGTMSLPVASRRSSTSGGYSTTSTSSHSTQSSSSSAPKSSWLRLRQDGAPPSCRGFA